ncbi:MAG: MBL fold metallo-hydrolase [Alphaproteobacteria bacterium]|nr:MBL fold metallo-hydrolase [Alphaproteobacteria bacterium]
MASLVPVDALEVDILVDNVTDNLSSVPAFVDIEMLSLGRRGFARTGGRALCVAAHGLSCLVTVRHGDRIRRLLFDTGPDEEVFERNAGLLQVDLGAVEAIILSHGHWDHGGAMLRALDMIRARNGGRAVECYVHPGMFVTRATKSADGTMRLLEDVPSMAALGARGGRVVCGTASVDVLDGCVHVSGEIPRLTPFERGLQSQHRRVDDASPWEPDPLLMDERFAAVHVAGKGLVVFTACSHAGVVNVLNHARAGFPGVPLHAVIGGLHLVGSNEKIIPETVAALRDFGLATIAAGHCTGWRAMTALANAFGDARLAPLAVGKRYRF